MNYLDLSGDALSCLRVLARITSGYTSEIASLAGFGFARTKDALHELVDKGLIGLVVPRSEGERETKMIDNVGEEGRVVSIEVAKDARKADISKGEREYPHWKIRRNGISVVLRSWGVPPRHEFINRRERRTPAVGRHRTAAHQWPAWLKKAWPHAQIWTGWSEVKMPKWASYPDAIAWGTLDDRETLFWLEVESGHSAGDLIMKKTARRLLLAGDYAKSMKLRLVFAFLGMPWVRSAARLSFVGIPEHVAVVVGDWQQFGVLPAPQWGRARFIGE